jgi:hypothetical protein
MESLAINNSVVRGAGTPNYSNAYKEQSAMIFIANKYTRIYFSIIEKAKLRVLPKTEYKETHHIVPRSLGGSNEVDNLVDLTYTEHRLCHKLLVKMTTGIDKSKMSYALLFFKISATTKTSLLESLSNYRKDFTPITDGIIDKWIRKDMEIPKGYYYGFSPATIKKHGDGNKGKKWITNGEVSYQIKHDTLPEGFYYGQTEEHRVKNSKALSGNKNPMFGKVGNQHPAFGNKHTDEMIAYLSETRMGTQNPMYGKLPHNAKSIEINGVVYSSMSEARLKTGLSRRTIENLVKSDLTTTADCVIL